MSKKYFLFIWGCQMNKADAERIAGDYESRGFEEAETPDEADEIILTSCSVRKSAEDRVFGTVRNLAKKFKDSKKKPKIILTGCMLHYGADRLKKMLPEIDEFLPIAEVGFNNPSIRRDKIHAWVPISSGCNSFCSYCIVPFSRGREVSRPHREIIDEVKALAKRGYKEVTLLGQNVNSYGLEKIGIGIRKRLDENREAPSRLPFVRLLNEVCKISGIEKVNFLTSNPWDFYEEIIDCVARNPKISRTINLPVQSGDNEILLKMNRCYTRGQYLKLIKRIRKKIPDIQFTSDVIVGFPGETEEQFQNTVDLLKSAGFKQVFVSRYSPRPGTVSAKKYKDDIPHEEKKRRWEIINNLVNKDLG